MSDAPFPLLRTKLLRPLPAPSLVPRQRLVDKLSERPDDTDARQAVVILRLRDRDEVGSTFIRILDRYAKSLQARDSKLMRVGVGQDVYGQLSKTGVLDVIGRENVFAAQRKLAASLFDAYAAANAWLAAREPEAPLDSQP
jgi:SulP family sulfate permease